MVGVRFTAAASVSAPASGVRLGTGPGGPLQLRLFRVSGTRIVLTSRLLPAQLLVIRTAASGTPVQVVTSRPQLWAPLLRHDTATHLVTAVEIRQMPGGPTLIVDDRPAEAQVPTEVGPWQCRVDVRARWDVTELRAFARTDLAIFGTAGEDLVPRIADAFGVPAHAAHGVAQLDASTFAVLRRGRIEYVTLDPSHAESELLDDATGYGPTTGVHRR